MVAFKVFSNYKPQGDQPQAIEKILECVNKKDRFITLLGVTGSGKTYSIAKVIEKLNPVRPILVISHNKTLAAQLFQEFKEFFPNNAVEYFVSYYDYYQPEAYIPAYDRLIEKETSINEEIERFRNSTTRSLMERKDVIVVASVSCIYGLGSPEHYKNIGILLSEGLGISREKVIERLVEMQYTRNQVTLDRGNFRAHGDNLEIHTAYEDTIIRVGFFGNEIEKIQVVDLLQGKLIESVNSLFVYPAKHYVIPEEMLKIGMEKIRNELEERLGYFESKNKLVEAQRLKQRTDYDLETIEHLGYCSGIENYSAPLDGRKSGQAPSTLIDFFGKDWLLVIDESHVTIPQIKGMYKGDRSRKTTLIDYGFRLPSAADNRPLKWEEFLTKINQTIFVSATPTNFEKSLSDHIVEQLIRPTGLIDPEVTIQPTENQIDHLVSEIRKVIDKGGRILVTTLTKKLSEHLDDYLREIGIKSQYLHSEVHTLERNVIIRNLRKGEFDVLVGINLLREGLDLPEVELVAILDADKEGFLRTETSLIQTIGRAARNVDGRVILYADRITKSMEGALNETNRRRKIQQEYNEKHGIEPRSIQKSIREDALSAKDRLQQADISTDIDDIEDIELLIDNLREAMKQAAAELEFERAAKLRDQISNMTNQLKRKKKK